MKKLAVILFSLFSICKSGLAQYANQQALYNNLPQAQYLNPGIFPEYSGYFSLPAFSGYGLTASNSGFSFSDLFDDGSLNFNAFLGSLSKKNYLNFGFATDVVGMGFKAKKNYFSFNVTPKVDFNLGYNKEVFDFLINGNAKYLGEEISLDGFSFDVSTYMEAAFGFSRKINDKISAGGRFKLLYSGANINGDFDGINLFTDPDDYSITASSDFNVDVYGSYFFKEDSALAAMGNPSAFNPSNFGLGIDFGASYQFSEKLGFFGNVVDLGYLKWSDYGERFYNDGASFTWEGMSYDDFSGEGDSSEENGGVGDSIANEFELKSKTTSYTTRLKTKIFLGANYELNKNVDLQGLINGRFYNNKLYPMYMVAGSIHLKKWLTTKLTYSGINGTYDNIGAGIVLHLGPLQVYAMMDNVYGVTQIDYARYLSGSFGINFTFKDSENKKKKKEKSKDKKSSKEKSGSDSKKSNEKKDKVEEPKQGEKPQEGTLQIKDKENQIEEKEAKADKAESKEKTEAVEDMKSVVPVKKLDTVSVKKVVQVKDSIDVEVIANDFSDSIPLMPKKDSVYVQPANDSIMINKKSSADTIGIARPFVDSLIVAEPPIKDSVLTDSLKTADFPLNQDSMPTFKKLNAPVLENKKDSTAVESTK